MMQTVQASGVRGERRRGEVTGWRVLACLVAFFAVVFAANAALVYAALSTFGGVETRSSYQAGLAFSREIQAAKAQEARHWRVDAGVTGKAKNVAHIEIVAREADGRMLRALDAAVLMAHPTDRRRDYRVAMTEIAPGRYAGTAAIAPGLWDLVIELDRGGARMFRSRSRVVLK